jgi:Predicted membrane protein
MAFLLVQQLTLPVLLVVFVNAHAASAVLTAMATWMFFSMHLVSVELEDPFGYDWNDLPLDWCA